ncbi:MAG: hypothetical protein ACQKBY_09485, partial [Verrucomicrobiales bacterium]
GEENFWPTLSHSSGGKLYLVDGARSAILRVEGLASLRRVEGGEVEVTEELLKKCHEWQVEVEALRQEHEDSGVLQARVREEKPVVDGELGDWAGAKWVDIDKSGVKAYFNADSKPYDVSAALAVAEGRLFAAWRTADENLLKNSGEMPLAPFKTGGALDLMLGPEKREGRREPVAGDLRLLVTLKEGKARAMLYRAVVSGTAEEAKVPFSSPWRTITFDEVREVTEELEFGQAGGNYEISVPLKLLGISGTAGTSLRGDVGVLRGNGRETTARVYWSNKATAITADVPEEAKLVPLLWGEIEFVSE